jgi:hypothetical protein
MCGVRQNVRTTENNNERKNRKGRKTEKNDQKKKEITD